MLAYEVFACGVLPYADTADNLTEISNYVKEGGQLSRPDPDTCPLAVYNELMLPCFAADPAARPAFGLLYDVAVLHGAEEDEEALAERKNTGGTCPRHASVVMTDRAYHAPSVHYLQEALVPELMAAVEPTVQANLAGRGDPEDEFPLLDAAQSSSYQIKDFIVLPRTKEIMCPRDGQQGGVFVDTLVGADNVGPATAILSYAWRYPIRLVAGATVDWCKAGGLSPSRQYIWIDVLCWNQHGRIGDPVAEWEFRVEAIGHQLTMLHPWNKPIYVTRGWCGKDLDTSLVVPTRPHQTIIRV